MWRGCRISAGELSHSNYNRIQQLQHDISSLISKHETREMISKVLDSHREDVKSIYSFVTPLDLTSKIQQMQVDLSKRLTGLETVMPCKVDRSEVDAMDILCTRLREYDSFRDKCEQDISIIHDNIDALGSKCQTNSRDIYKDNERLRHIEVSVGLCASSRDLSDVRAHIDRTTAVIASLCPRVVCEEVRK